MPHSKTKKSERKLLLQGSCCWNQSRPGLMKWRQQTKNQNTLVTVFLPSLCSAEAALATQPHQPFHQGHSNPKWVAMGNKLLWCQLELKVLDMRELYPLYAWKISGTTEAGKEHSSNNESGKADVSLTFAPCTWTPHLPPCLSGPERNCK